METITLHAEYIDYMNSYRVYDPKKPYQTCFYADDEDKEIICAKKNEKFTYRGNISLRIVIEK